MSIVLYKLLMFLKLHTNLKITQGQIKDTIKIVRETSMKYLFSTLRFIFLQPSSGQ